jgi:hypothetical protein
MKRPTYRAAAATAPRAAAFISLSSAAQGGQEIVAQEDLIHCFVDGAALLADIAYPRIALDVPAILYIDDIRLGREDLCGGGHWEACPRRSLGLRDRPPRSGRRPGDERDGPSRPALGPRPGQVPQKVALTLSSGRGGTR